MGKLIYLDHAAATPIAAEVLKAMQPYFSERFYNPSALYLASQEIRKDIETARSNIAQILGAKPAEIIFTAGGTEANNLAIHGVMRQYPKANLLVSAIEHEAVLHPASSYKHKIVPVLPDGLINLKNLKQQIDGRTALVSIMYANNEIGTVEPIIQVASLIGDIRRERRKSGNMLPIYFHTDACQAGNYLALHVSRLGVDLMTLNGGKIYGPKQSGILYVKAGIELSPLILGGGQERNLRSGTENVAGIIGMAKALEMAQLKRHTEVVRLQKLQDYFIEEVKHKIPRARINGSLKQRLPNNVHITITGQDNERLLIKLETEGVLAAAGSACSASSETASHVLEAIDLDEEQARASLRFTMGRSTTHSDIRRTISALASAIE